MRFIFRVLALFALAVAVVMAVVDATRTIAADEWIFTPIGTSWQATSPQTLSSFRQLVEESGIPMLWDPAITFVLSLPGWLVFAALALGFYALGHRRRRPGESLAAVR